MFKGFGKHLNHQVKGKQFIVIDQHWLVHIFKVEENSLSIFNKINSEKCQILALNPLTNHL